MTTNLSLDPSVSLGALVAERPARASVLDHLALDYCCGGGRSLVAACAERGLSLDDVVATLQAADSAGDAAGESDLTDWRSAEIDDLCRHIVTVHHDGLRRELPRIERLLSTVVRVHGAREARLGQAAEVFGAIRADLEPHLESEEAELFPACVECERSGAPVAEALLHHHEHEHADVGAALGELRALCDGYDRDRAFCNTHRSLLDALEAFESDLHRHVHEENNILLPRVRALSTRVA